MKNIILPKNDNRDISIAAINENTKGVIICYKDNNPRGYINYDSDTSEWGFNEDINMWHAEFCNNNLYDVIMGLLKDNTCNSFKLIEFNND